MHSQLRGRIVGYTVPSSVSISALSGGYVHDKGTPQSSLSTGLCDLCMVVGRLLGRFVVGLMLDSLVVDERARAYAPFHRTLSIVVTESLCAVPSNAFHRSHLLRRHLRRRWQQWTSRSLNKYSLLTSFLGPLCVRTDSHRADKMNCAICANWLAQSSQNVLYNLCKLNCTEQPKWSLQTDSHRSQLWPKIQSGVFLEIEILFSSPNFLSWGNFGHQIFVC